MSIVALDITGENKDLVAKLLQLEKRCETLEEKLRRLGSSSKRSSQDAASGFQDMALGVGKFAMALAGVGSIEAVIGKIINETRKGIEQMRKLREDALGSQQTFANAFGKFVSNNPLMADTEKARWKAFAEEQGRTGVGGGAAGVMSALSDLRGSTAGSSAEDQMAAMVEAVKKKRLDPETDLAAYSQAVLKIKDDLGGTITEASNRLAIYGERAGGDVAGLAGQIGKLKGLSGVTRSNINDALALHAFLTTETTDATGEASTTTVSNLLARAATRDVELGGKKVQLQSETGLDRLLETLEMINSGKFGDPSRALTEYTRELGRESASAIIALGSLRVGSGKFAETRKMIETGASGVDLTAQGLAAKEKLFPAYGAMVGIRKAEGEKEASELGNVSGASVAGAEQELVPWEKSMGLGTTWDITRPARRLYAEKYTPSVDYLDQEKRSRLQRQIMARLGPAGVVGMSGPTGAAAAVIGAPDVQGMLAAGAVGGAIDTGTRLDLLEQQMLRAAGAPEERVAALQQQFEQGMKDAFKQGLSELIMELRQNRSQTRQELD